MQFFAYLVLNGTTPREITVLTFYNGQRKLILRKLREHRHLQGAKFNVVTVDSYQGEENDVVGTVMFHRPLFCPHSENLPFLKPLALGKPPRLTLYLDTIIPCQKQHSRKHWFSGGREPGLCCDISKSAWTFYLRRCAKSLQVQHAVVGYRPSYDKTPVSCRILPAFDLQEAQQEDFCQR